jgi:hypothetical protein
MMGFAGILPISHVTRSEVNNETCPVESMVLETLLDGKSGVSLSSARTAIHGWTEIVSTPNEC